MKLFYHPLSSYSRKAAIGIGLRGDPVEFVVVDAIGGELKSSGYLAKNPFGKMPVLETDSGECVYESTSILEYLEETRGPRLIPEASARRQRHFDRLGDLYLLDPIGAYFWKKTDEVRKKTAHVMSVAWGVWESELSDGRSFVLGDEITLADLSAAVAAHYAETEGLEVPKAIAAYRERLMANEVVAASAQKAMPFVEGTKPMRPSV